MAGNSVPAFFGAKAQTRRPSAVDVTITYDHSVSNGSFIEAFRSIDNIKELEAQLYAEGVGAGSDLNRYSITSFEFLMHTLLNNQARVWIESDELEAPSLEWADSRNVKLNGTSDEDETGSIYNLITGNRSVKTLVANPSSQWPRTEDSWPSAQQPSGPVIDGSYRAAPGNTIKSIIISQSTEEASADLAIEGTYGIANGPINSSYNTDNRGPSNNAGNNTSTTELSDALDDKTLGQILVFIDNVTLSCDLQNQHVSAGLVPDNTYIVAGVVFPSPTAWTVIYVPSTGIASKETTYFVSNVPPESISGLSPDVPGDERATNTAHYARKTNGAVLAQNAISGNFPLAFWALGRVLGKYLYDTSF
jgi:hypothetical protein